MARWSRVVMLLLGGLLLAGQARADEPAPYPSRPLHLIVPSAPAGAGDALAREVASRLARVLDVPVVVENRAGASGIVGTEIAARSAADGYTLLFATSATQVITPLVARSTRFDPIVDFEPVANLGFATSVVVVRADLPVKTLADLVRYARLHPGTLAYASSGAGSANHLDMEVLSSLTGMTLLHVPYRGTADGYRGLVAGEVQVMVGAITSALPHVRAGTVRPIAVMAAARSSLLPDVPTLAEAGAGDADVRKWMGIVAPAGTPPAIIGRLNAALVRVVDSPSMRAWMQAQGFEPAGGSPADFRRTLRDDTRKWSDIVERVIRDAR